LAGLHIQEKAPKQFMIFIRALNWHRRRRPSLEGVNRFGAAFNEGGNPWQGFSASFSYLR